MNKENIVHPSGSRILITGRKTGRILVDETTQNFENVLFFNSKISVFIYINTLHVF